MPLCFVVWFLVLVRQCSGVIYFLNETEYARMPPIYHVDNVTECLRTHDDVFCTVNFNLVSDGPSTLLQMIQEYSKKKSTHFNHTRIRYSVCVSRTCQPYIPNTTAVTAESLEGCLNESIWQNYKLKTKLEKHYCHRANDIIDVDISDILVAVMLLAIVVVNIIGSISDNRCTVNGKEERSMLSCFSIRRNWLNLVRNSNHTDPRLRRLRGINFWRCIILLGVIMVHSTWPYLIALDNPYNIEMNFHDLSQHIIINGSIALQTYLVISGFLMSYKMEIYSEKNTPSWRDVPRGIIERYFRLTPVYAVAIALMATWTKFIGPGPFWEVSGGLEWSQCRSRWWQNLLYINNYFYNSQCILAAWYLGVDMQLFILGIITCVALRHQRRRPAVLATLFIIGTIVPAVHIYLRDLSPIMMLEPDEARTLFENEPTFNEAYKMGHANVASYVVGLTSGYAVYRLQQRRVDFKKNTIYRCIYWALLPLLIAVILSGSIFYRDAPRDPTYVRAIWGALVKPIWGIVTAGLICGAILKIETVYRRVFECRVWSVPARLSYCVYIIHVPYLRLFVASRTALLHHTNLNQLLMLLCAAAASFATAVPVWLLVEAPFIQLTKYWTFGKTLTRASDKQPPVTTASQGKIENITRL